MSKISSTLHPQAEALSATQIEQLSAVGITVTCSDAATVARPGVRAFVDVNGTYEEWLNVIGGESVLVRPDFYLFGVATGVDGGCDLADAFLAQLASMTHVSVPTLASAE